MAHASKKKIGKGAQGKGQGSGAMTTMPPDKIGENMILSNRDKSRSPPERGLDSRHIMNEQAQDHVHNRIPDEGALQTDDGQNDEAQSGAEQAQDEKREPR